MQKNRRPKVLDLPATQPPTIAIFAEPSLSTRQQRRLAISPRSAYLAAERSVHFTEYFTLYEKLIHSNAKFHWWQKDLCISQNISHYMKNIEKLIHSNAKFRWWQKDLCIFGQYPQYPNMPNIPMPRAESVSPDPMPRNDAMLKSILKFPFPMMFKSKRDHHTGRGWRQKTYYLFQQKEVPRLLLGFLFRGFL